MKRLRIAATALNQTPLDWDGNRNRIVDAIERARADGAQVVCLPELCITGYGCEDAFHSPGTWRMALRVLDEVLPHTRGLCVSVGLPLYHGGAIYNGAALLVDGGLRGIVLKRNLAGDGIHYEPRWFKAWRDGVTANVEIGGAPVPIGDLMFDVGGLRLGFEICEDAWVHDRPGGALAQRGVDVILNPSASHFAFAKKSVRERFVLEGSRAFGVTYAYSNLLGNEAGRVIYDGHAMIAAGGRMLVTGPRFRFERVVVTTAEVDIDELRAARARRLSYTPDVGGEGIVRVAHRWPTPAARLASVPIDAWDVEPTREEEFTRAVALGLRDSMSKSRSNGFVVSLSGGADSSAVVALVATMVDLATSELGLAAVASEFGCADASTPRDIVASLLTTAYQATRNSSGATRDAARRLAEALGGVHHELDVDEIVTRYTAMIETAIGRTLTWADDDIALQNVQARTRVPAVWLLANIENKLLLSTSNRSEAAVGYATMDGDTAGGLAPIAGIDKAFLREWLRWMERTGPDGAHPIAALSAVNALTPTAELRPAEHTQTDEGDLMPYPILDAIEEAAIGRKLSPPDVLEHIATSFPHFDRERHRAWVERFYRLWSRNQWKRERYAPAYHVDDRNLDPKTWCRFPILSGGFDRELRELRATPEATP